MHLAQRGVRELDRSDHVVVRICEVWGSRGPARLTLNLPVAAAWRTDLLERDLAEVPLNDNAVTLELRPFELVTLKFALAG